MYKKSRDAGCEKKSHPCWCTMWEVLPGKFSNNGNVLRVWKNLYSERKFQEKISKPWVCLKGETATDQSM